jgi:hypothetical protein
MSTLKELFDSHGPGVRVKKRPTIADVRRRWRFVPKCVRRALFVENMIEAIEFFHDELPNVYSEVTGGRLSYPDYTAGAVISAFHDHLEDQRKYWEEDFREDNDCNCGMETQS